VRYQLQTTAPFLLTARPKAGSGIKISEFPALKKWRDLILERPGVEKGRNVPSPHKALDQEKMSEEEIAAAAKKNAAWIQAGMKADAK
jgi:glutathione S-transferase